MENENWHGYICDSDDGVMLSMWSINRLWQYAAALPVEMIPLSEFAETLEETLTLTKREMAEKVRRIMDADLSCPIIFSARGWLMDGSHRVMKALSLGYTEIRAVRFQQDPPPDQIKPLREVFPTQG